MDNQYIQIKLLEIAGLGSALQALHLPFGKECRSCVNHSVDFIGSTLKTHYIVTTADKDLILLTTLVKRGDEHAKVLRGVMVWLEINAPRFWWQECDRYSVGACCLSSESTMHGVAKGLSGDELVRVKSELKEGTMQKRVWVFSYQALRRIYRQRHNHRLPHWKCFCDFIETLPYANELIVSDSSAH